MLTALMMGIIWTVYGILGLCGIQRIPLEYRGASFEREYKKKSGISWLLIGVPYLAACLALRHTALTRKEFALTFGLLALPCIVYTYITNQKFRKRLEEEKQ